MPTARLLLAGVAIGYVVLIAKIHAAIYDRAAG
jgi:hypothetical protein